jgi:multicomponent Na+:H+ antiporter subunit F
MTFHSLLYMAMTGLILLSFLCLYRVAKGPTAADRTVAMEALSTVLIAFCCMFALLQEREWYMSMAIVWALMSFIGSIALAKYLEGRFYDE